MVMFKDVFFVYQILHYETNFLTQSKKPEPYDLPLWFLSVLTMYSSDNLHQIMQWEIVINVLHPKGIYLIRSLLWSTFCGIFFLTSIVPGTPHDQLEKGPSEKLSLYLTCIELLIAYMYVSCFGLFHSLTSNIAFLIRSYNLSKYIENAVIQQQFFF